ncbi:auxin-induced protein X10A-like [Abrus precatorius]|uniref:Auxin-induced protein X10A-like n=1 Tax=Abrus precatorius TaxID=3816 RepID=A0A8B8LGS6_ABRPR|nr:auxin-induced protein X10A-like [Abrus precatorius]
MGFHLKGLKGIRRSSLPTTQTASKGVEVPKGYLAVYVGDNMRRFVIPISYLNQPSFQDLLSQSEEEFGYSHPRGGLTIPYENFTLFFKTFEMGFHLPSIRRASFTGSQASSKVVNVPKGYLAVYVGEKMKRFVIPISYLNQPAFQELLSQVEGEFGHDHPRGGLTIPCMEDVFLQVTSQLNEL